MDTRRGPAVGRGPDRASAATAAVRRSPESRAAASGARVALVGGLGLFVALALAVELHWAPLEQTDLAVVESVHGWVSERPPIVAVARWGAIALGPATFRSIAFVVAVWVWVRRGRWRPAVWLLVATTVTGLLGAAVKLLIRRDRPGLADPVASVAGYSFPSGHALNSAFVIAGLLLLAWPGLFARTRAAAMVAGSAVVVLVGLDRIILGAHYPSDVLGGWLLAGGIVGAFAVALPSWVAGGGPRQPGG